MKRFPRIALFFFLAFLLAACEENNDEEEFLLAAANQANIGVTKCVAWDTELNATEPSLQEGYRNATGKVCIQDQINRWLPNEQYYVAYHKKLKGWAKGKDYILMLDGFNVGYVHQDLNTTHEEFGGANGTKGPCVSHGGVAKDCVNGKIACVDGWVSNYKCPDKLSIFDVFKISSNGSISDVLGLCSEHGGIDTCDKGEIICTDSFRPESSCNSTFFHNYVKKSRFNTHNGTDQLTCCPNHIGIARCEDGKVICIDGFESPCECDDIVIRNVCADHGGIQGSQVNNNLLCNDGTVSDGKYPDDCCNGHLGPAKYCDNGKLMCKDNTVSNCTCPDDYVQSIDDLSIGYASFKLLGTGFVVTDVLRDAIVHDSGWAELKIVVPSNSTSSK